MAEALPRRGDALDGAWAQAAALAFRFLFLAVAAIAAAWALSNVRQVPPESRAVVLRFGNVVRVEGPGLLVAWPRPIEEVRLVPAAEQPIAFRIGRFEGGEVVPGGRTVAVNGPDTRVTYQAYSSFDISDDPRKNSGFLLTGDGSVVHLQATLFYRVVDPVAYVIAAEHVAPALERLFVASSVAVAGRRDLDTILVARPELGAAANEAARAGREALRGDIMNAVNRRLEALAAAGSGLGIEVSRVDLAAAIPTGAKQAFDQVLIETQWAERSIAQARTTAATKAQKANQESDRILAEAQAAAAERVSDAATRTAAIAALATGASGVPRALLLTRAYYDRIGAVLRSAQWVNTVDAESGMRVLLPGPTQK